MLADNSRCVWNPRNIACIREWLRECIAEYTYCKMPSQILGRREVPKRLLSLSRDESQSIRARLVLITECNPRDVCYLALSHCWGFNNFLLLKKENYGTFLRNIPVYDPSFNRTFQDAFQITLDLGYHYIWIDSLCILQDLLADWAD